MMRVQVADCQTYVKSLHQIHLHYPWLVLIHFLIPFCLLMVLLSHLLGNDPLRLHCWWSIFAVNFLVCRSNLWVDDMGMTLAVRIRTFLSAGCCCLISTFRP
ncbi:hypothetical protein B0H34DRAFT_189983 [Crassisporium funariophilum]|nr:hypothetical protein B0H34DRAFT_189983 [Crassisporium funariophilum]